MECFIYFSQTEQIDSNLAVSTKRPRCAGLAKNRGDIPELGPVRSNAIEEKETRAAAPKPCTPGDSGWDSLSKLVVRQRLMRQRVRCQRRKKPEPHGVGVGSSGRRLSLQKIVPFPRDTRMGDTDGNPKTDADPSFLPFIVTPCFPSYPSNHGSGTKAAAVQNQ